MYICYLCMYTLILVSAYPCRQQWQAEPGHRRTWCMTLAGSPCNCGDWVTEQLGAPEWPAEAKNKPQTPISVYPQVRVSHSFIYTISVWQVWLCSCVLTLWMPSSLTQMLLNKVLKILLSTKAKKRMVLSCREWAISSKMAVASSRTSSAVLPISCETYTNRKFECQLLR